MNRKAIALLFAFFTCFFASGCQLAREDLAETRGSDRLIGVFITREHLDLFDMERYLNDNIHKIAKGGSIAIDGDISKYEGRLYAEIVTRTLTNPETGKSFEITEFSFEGIDGIPYFCATKPPNGYENDFTINGSDEAISDGFSRTLFNDEEDRIELEGTIYFGAFRNSRTSFFMNPIYQGQDGRIYVVSNTGTIMAGDQSEGTAFTQTIESTTTVTENGKSKTHHALIRMSFVAVNPPRQVIVLQMDEDSNILSREAYTPGQMPGTLTPESNAAYLIVETHKQDQDGNRVVSRALYDESHKHLETLYCKPDGICVKQFTELNWNRP